jgi:hypothetical protein
MNTNTCTCGAAVISYEGWVCAACREASSVVVAVITVDAPFNLDRSQESASAYHTIRVDAGTYPVDVRLDGRGRRYVTARFSGVVLSSGYGGRRYHEHEGKTDTVALSPYKYELRNGKFWGRVQMVNEAELDRAEGM